MIQLLNYSTTTMQNYGYVIAGKSTSTYKLANARQHYSLDPVLKEGFPDEQPFASYIISLSLSMPPRLHPEGLGSAQCAGLLRTDC